MENKKYPFGLVFIDGKAQLPKNAKFEGILYFCKESNTRNMTGSWLEKYVSDIAGLTINEILEEELMSFSIIFKFPNGYGVVVEFESDNTKTCDDYYIHAIDTNVEMLDKNGETFTDDSYEKSRTSKFPDKYRKDGVLPYQVELFLEEVKNI